MEAFEKEENVVEMPVEKEDMGNEPAPDNRQEFIKAVNNVEVPISVGMNALREDINKVISNSPLHIECMLEVFRSTCSMLEKVAAENAEKETNAYYSKIEELREKFGITE